MGNVLDTLTSFLPFVLLFYLLWCLNVVKFLFTLLVDQPWGMVSERKRMIARAQRRREEGFACWRTKISDADENVVHRWQQITSLSLGELRDTLQREEITAVQALEAYVYKALLVQEVFNPITEIIREAFEYAEEVDSIWRGKENKPPLYGVPFSVKSNFHMVGYDCHVGLGKLLEQPKDRECTMVTHLRHLGAVPFCLTNVPQGLLSFVFSNSVYGTTGNPHDVNRTPGGSSGGEACLLVAGGSPFGTGSDVGGSLRIPAALSGCVTLKCGQERLVVLHSHGGIPGRGRLGLGFGYFTKTVQDQVLLLKDTLGHPYFCDLSPTTPKLGFDIETLNSASPLRIGYFDSDGFMRPAPAMARAVRETVDKLREVGHEMIRFEIPEPCKAAKLTFKNLLPDGGEYTRNLYAADVVDMHMKEFVRLLSIPKFVRRCLSVLFRPFSTQASIICDSTVQDLSDLRQTQEDADEYKIKFIEYWKEAGIDALICPAFPAPAVEHKWPSNLSSFAFSTTLWNLLDFPAGVVPVDKARKEDDLEIVDEARFPTGYNIALHYLRDSASRCAGLPIAVQIVCLPYQEEKCLRVMKDVESVSNYDPIL